MSNPIYGLACPKKINTKVITPLQKKCGCTMKTNPHPTKPHVNHPTNILKSYGSIVFNNVTNTPFDTQVHILNLSNGQGTVTNANGQFIIQALPTDLLKITHIGFGEVTVKASELTDKITLDEDLQDLDEVVITPKSKKNGALIALALAGVLAVVYASSDDDKKKVSV